jgi:hypothetical protein
MYPPYHASTRLIVRWISILILISLAFPANLPAQTAPLAASILMSLNPSSLRPGGATQVKVINLTSGLYYLSAPCFDGVIDVAGDRNGVFTQAVPIPLSTKAPATCRFTLRNHSEEIVVQVDLNLLAPVKLSLNPTFGKPGSNIQFTVTNLVPGSTLRLDYAGAIIFGPAPVGGSPYPWPAPPTSFSGSFTVPSDRPVPLGATTVVTATNLSGGVPMAQAAAVFQSQAPAGSFVFSFSHMQMAAPLIAAGAPFTITGRLTPPPDENTHIASLYTESVTRTIPLDSDLVILDRLGGFQMTGTFPDLRKGDAMVPGTLGKIKVSAYSNEANGNWYEIPASPPSYRPPLNVIVKAADTGLPLPGAVVTIMAAPNLNYDRGLSAPHVDIYNDVNQVSAWAWEHGVINNLNAKDGRLTDLMCNGKTVAITDKNGEHTYNNLNSMFEILTDHQALMESIWQKVINDYNTSTTTPMLGITYPENLGPDIIPDPIHYEAYIVAADAMIYGYGNVDTEGVPFPSYEVVYFNPARATWLDADMKILPDRTLTLLESPLPAGYQFKIDSIFPTFTNWTTLYGFKDVVGAELSPLPVDYVFVNLDMLDWTVSHYIDRIQLIPPSGSGAPYNLTYSTSQDPYSECVARSPMMGHFEGEFDLDMSTLGPGIVNFSVVIYPKPGFGQSRTIEYTLAVNDVPAWFYDQSITSRKAFAAAYYNPENGYMLSGIKLTGIRLDKNTSTVGNQGWIPNYGADNTVYNSVAAGLTIEAILGDYGFQEKQKSGLTTKVLDVDTNTPISTGGSATALQAYGPQSLVQDYCAAPGVNAIPFDSGGKQPLFDTGRIDLAAFTYPTAFGPVSASVGFSYAAGLTYEGYTQTDPPYSCMVAVPESEFGTWFDAHVDFLYFIGTGGASFLARNDEKLTTAYVNGTPTFDPSWGYRGDLDIYWGLLCVCGNCAIWHHSPHTPYCHNYDCGKAALSDPQSSSQASGALSQIPTPASGSLPGKPPDVHVNLATDGSGQVMQLAVGPNQQIRTHLFDGVNWGITSTIKTSIFPINTSLAYYDTGKAVALWSESSLPYTKDITLTHTITQMYQSYHMAFSNWDGINWSPEISLTQPTTGDAQGSLAACPAGLAGCPADGEVTALWTHDRAGSPSQRLYSVKTARFDPATLAWTTPASLDPLDPSHGADTQPAAIYAYRLPGDTARIPFAAWIRDADTSFNTLSDRVIATRWIGACGPVLHPCPVTVLKGLPDGIMQFSLGATPDGKVKLVFTRSEGTALAPAAAIDTRHVLYSAELVCTPSILPGYPPSCSWTHVQKLLDSHGRAFYGEDPTLTIDNQGQATITFRGMGFTPSLDGSTPSYPEDALGMITTRGDLAQAEINFTSPVAGLHYLTNDAAFNWNANALYLPQMDQTLAMAIRGPQLAITTDQRRQVQPEAERISASALATSAANSIVAFAAVPRQPDFDIASISATPALPQTGQPLTVDVAIRNDALGWIASTHPLSVTATWDGPIGLGRPAGSATIAKLGAGETVTLTLSLNLLDLNFVDFSHTLYVTANPAQNIPELSPANNTRTLVLGNMEAPAGVTASAETGQLLVSVKWEQVSDPRLVGYRIYRAEGNGAFKPVGTSFVPGFIDVTAQLDKNYRYAVTFYNIHGTESPLSGSYPVQTRSFRLFMPVIRRVTGK